LSSANAVETERTDKKPMIQRIDMRMTKAIMKLEAKYRAGRGMPRRETPPKASSLLHPKLGGMSSSERCYVTMRWANKCDKSEYFHV
jgi:hypothetical protein